MPRFALATLNHSPMHGCPTQWQAHLDATAAAGFDALAPDIFWLRALEREGVSLEALSDALAERSLACTELAGLTIADGRGGHGASPDRASTLEAEVDELARFARALGAEFVNARLLIPPDEHALARVRRIADRFSDASGAAGARLALEFSNTTTLPRLCEAEAFVAELADERVGLTLDTWHFFQDRAGPDWPGLAELPIAHLATVQLSDGVPFAALGGAEAVDYGEQTLQQRRMAGAGGFALARCARELREKGFDGAVVVEVLSAAQRARPLAEFARDAARSVRAWWG